MNLTNPLRLRRAAVLLAGALAVSLSLNGDHSVWSASPGNSGVDPLEILNLSIRPNAILVLDSSGSMGETLTGSALGADHPDAKLAVAKSVINSVVAANQTKVSFQFGQYDQPATSISNDVETDRLQNTPRFEYTVANPTFTAEPNVELRLFEVPAGSAWTVQFTNDSTTYTTASLTPGVYTGTELAQHIATLMNAEHAASYVGTFSDPVATVAPVFTFSRNGGAGFFSIKFQNMNSTLRNLLRAVSTESNDVTSPYSITPNLGSYTNFTVSSAGPNSFTITGSPTISIGRGATNYTGTLVAGTYTGSDLATHIASRMNAIDTTAVTTSYPNSFTVTGSPQIRIQRGNTAYTANLVNATYTGDTLAAHIAAKMNSADGGTDAQAFYAGSYNETNGIFTFTRSGTVTNAKFQISYSAWTGALRTLMGTPTADEATSNNGPYTLSTDGVSTTTTNASYAGSYNSSTGVFTFTRTGASTESFKINWSSWTAGLRTDIGAPSTDASDASSPFSLSSSGITVPVTSLGSTSTSNGPSNSTAPLVLYRSASSSSYEKASGGKTYYKMFANKFFNGETLTVLADGTPCQLTPGTPTSDPYVTITTVSACVSGTVTDRVTFPAAGSYSWSYSGSSCGGFRSLVSLVPCTENEQLGAISPHLQRELAAPDGTLPGYVETATGGLTTQPSVTGIRAAGNTPIAESLIDLRSIFISSVWPTVSAQTKKQSTFVIFLTDGDDTCDNSSGSNLNYTADQAALRAAHKAEMLRRRYVSTEPASSVTTFVIALGSGASAARANWIAWGGSGMSITDSADGIVGTADDLTASTRWKTIPTQAQRNACTTCRDAFLATDAASLTAALQSAIDLGQTAGEFSDQQSITETVFEYVNLAPAPSPSPSATPIVYSPLDPVTRYGSTIPVLLQSTFELPDYTGHLKAFRNNNGVSQQMWDAGAKLKTRVVDDTNAMGTGNYPFVTLYGNARSTAVRLSTARIKRRIFTSLRQGVLSGYTAQNLLNASAALAGSTSGDPTRVELWPPAASVAPTATVTGNSSDIGDLDAAFGLLAPTTVAQVQALIPAACQPSADVTPISHPSCTSNNANVQLAQARREAREIILAYLAGAQVAFLDGKPRRQSSDGALLFSARPWVMVESTLAAPAVVTPPLLAPTQTFKQAEYLLFRDGPRDAQGKAINATASGLGLRNPDLENPQSAASRDNLTLKPQMSVVYHATNLGLHAFRAGPCPTSVASAGLLASGALTCNGETGGEELWAFVPYDQLGKLISASKVQSRASKTYILASPVRISDVFVSGSASTTVSGNTVRVTGVWRTLAIFGRGAAGKSLTALDVTVPGPFVRHSLDANPPIVVWSRGNFDTTDGLVKSAGNSYVNTSADYNAYLGMGETWSVPSAGLVDNTAYVTARRSVDFALFAGSGFSDSTSEGKTFFVLDALSGDVLRSYAIPNGTTATTVLQTGRPLPNALPASPTVYAVDDAGNSPAGIQFLTNPVEAKAKYVYFGDLHSRIWRFAPATPLVSPTAIVDLSGEGDHPFSNGISLLEVGKVPNLWFSSGRDSRVNLRSNPPRFRMFGYADATAASPPGSVTQQFYRDFPSSFRGNSAPTAVFTGGDVDHDPATPPVYTPVVFFTAIAFTANGSTPETVCQSRFDSVLFALKGLTGVAAFDLSTSTNEADDAYVTVTGQILQNPHVTSEGTLVVDRGLGAQVAPPPPSVPITQELPPQNQTVTIVNQGLTPGTAAWNTLRATTTPSRTGSAVCNVNQ